MDPLSFILYKWLDVQHVYRKHMNLRIQSKCVILNCPIAIELTHTQWAVTKVKLSQQCEPHLSVSIKLFSRMICKNASSILKWQTISNIVFSLISAIVNQTNAEYMWLCGRLWAYACACQHESHTQLKMVHRWSFVVRLRLVYHHRRSRICNCARANFKTRDDKRPDRYVIQTVAKALKRAQSKIFRNFAVCVLNYELELIVK